MADTVPGNQPADIFILKEAIMTRTLTKVNQIIPGGWKASLTGHLFVKMVMLASGDHGAVFTTLWLQLGTR
jgi:hypothetical protein